MIKSVKTVEPELIEALGELIVELENGEKYDIVYYVDDKDEWHFFYEDGKKPGYIDFEHELMCSMQYGNKLTN